MCYPLTAFCTHNGLSEKLRMPQGAAGAPTYFIYAMRLVTASLDNIRMYLSDAIRSDSTHINHLATLATFLARLRLQMFNLFPSKFRT